MHLNYRIFCASCGIFHRYMKNMKSVFLVLVALIMWGASCKDVTSAEKDKVKLNKSVNDLTIGFYNVENIYDTSDDPNTLDNDFTPSGKYEWTPDRYKTKLDRVSEVLSLMDNDLPDVVGLCEIENKGVLEDLIATSLLRPGQYGIVHYDSPDERGIDVALIYKRSVLELEHSEKIKVVLPVNEDPNTRDILYVRAKAGGQALHFFVNHWPSRRAGQQESEPSRIKAAEIVKTRMDAILSSDPSARILMMGDFNDYPTDKSIREVIGASGNRGGLFYNTVDSLNAIGQGSYWYKGAWNALDQIIISNSLVSGNEGWVLDNSRPVRFINDERLLFRDREGVARPNRTYVGDDYKGGYSDHLAVVSYFKRRE